MSVGLDPLEGDFLTWDQWTLSLSACLLFFYCIKVLFCVL